MSERDSAAKGSFGRDFLGREMDVERFSFHHLHVLHFWIIVVLVVAPASPQNARKITIYEIFSAIEIDVYAYLRSIGFLHPHM